MNCPICQKDALIERVAHEFIGGSLTEEHPKSTRLAEEFQVFDCRSGACERTAVFVPVHHHDEYRDLLIVDCAAPAAPALVPTAVVPESAPLDSECV